MDALVAKIRNVVLSISSRFPLVSTFRVRCPPRLLLRFVGVYLGGGCSRNRWTSSVPARGPEILKFAIGYFTPSFQGSINDGLSRPELQVNTEIPLSS